MWVDLVGYLGTAIFISGYAMDKVISLRIVSLISSVVLFLYGFLITSYPIMIEEVVFVPVNAWGLYKMVRLIRQSKEAVEGHPTVDWVRPFATKVRCEEGQVLFQEGDPANDMYCVESGVFSLVGTDIQMAKGDIIGELGFLSPGNRRTQTLRCDGAGVLLRISYDSLKELYFQNPRFGFLLLRLVSERLFRDRAALQQVAT